MVKVCLTEKVTPDVDRIQKLENYKKSLHDIHKKYNTNVLYINDPSRKVLYEKDNKFICAVLKAYNYHLDLKLRADDLWIVIAQGIAEHIHKNADKLRKKFVDHDGKKKLVVEALTYEDCVEKIHLAIKNEIKNPDFASLMACDFSTSDITSKTAASVCLMASMKHFFEYKIILCCGIPNIILDGELEDWQKLIDKVQKLIDMKIGLDWWLKELINVLQEFVNAYQGAVNERFWSTIITHDVEWGSGPGPITITGWLVKFFPYDSLGNKRTNVNKAIYLDDLPNGECSVPFFHSNVNEEMNFVSGFLGVDVNCDELYVSPLIGWYIEKHNRDPSNTIQTVEQSLLKRILKCFN